MSSGGMIERLRQVWERIGPTEGPGHTDYTETDIRVHRWISTILFGFGGVLMAGMVYNGDGSLLHIVSALAIMNVFFIASVRMRLTALKWEVRYSE